MCVCKCVYNWFILLYTWNSVNQLFTMIEGRRRRGGQRMRWFNGITDSMDMNLGKLWKMVKDREAWHAAVHGITKSWTRLSDWLNWRFESGIEEWEVCPYHPFRNNTYFLSLFPNLLCFIWYKYKPTTKFVFLFIYMFIVSLQLNYMVHEDRI